MNRFSLSWPRLVRHGIVWLLVGTFFGFLAWREPAKAAAGLRFAAGLVALLATAIYTHYWLLTHLFERRRYAAYASATLATLVAGGLVLHLTNQLVKVTVQPEGQSLVRFSQLGLAMVNVGLVLLLATTVRYVRRGVLSHFQLQRLRTLQLETELNLLKAQVNQHFLFNTLNNLYGLSLATPDQVPEALLQLADLLRYQLDSSRQQTTTVGTEATYLANYVGLERLRLRANTQVTFHEELPWPDQPLVPLLLLPLVENCFKHAIGPSEDNVIRLDLIQTATTLTLSTYNSIPRHFRPVPSGVGLPTLRARLAQFYPGERHQLTIAAQEDYFTATLHLSL